jgi:DNA-binding response OmpR family regulator
MAGANAESRSTDLTAVTVMLVEPDVVIRIVVGEYLRECGYRVIEGANAADFWTVLDNQTIVDIVLIHVQLNGDVDGFTLARQIRERNPNIDVILTSGVARISGRASELCEDGPLKKPYHPQEVIRRIHLMRERRRTETNSRGTEP